VESIIAATPRAIIVAAAYREDPAVTHWRRWRALSAVEHDRVFVVSPDILHRHTSRILDGISELCGQLALVHS
jgi:iron complex transport system substrate-binding protein